MVGKLYQWRCRTQSPLAMSMHCQAAQQKIISIGPVENVHHHHGQKAKEQLLV
jgi:hypothetical protein